MTDVRNIAQEAVELSSGEALSWNTRDCEFPGDVVVTYPDSRTERFYAQKHAPFIAHAGTHYATIARALIEALDSSRSWDDAHNDACKELDRALADRDAALRNLRVTSEALSEVAQDRDKILAALPHALGSCKCERQEWDETRQLPPWPVEHEAAIEWLRGRIE